MEAQLRALLYNLFEERRVAFNPLEPEPFDLVDLTRDVTNSTRIYHLRTECLREALAGANLIVADSQPLAEVVRRVLPKTMVTVLPFGLNWPVRTTRNEQQVIGLLNHNGDVEMNNAYALKMLKALKRELLIFGRALPGLEAEVTEDFEAFCQKCDVLLLPSLPGVINSTTLPLSVMASDIAILAQNAPGYYDLDAATGVQLLADSRDPEHWLKYLERLEAQPAILRTMQERNGIYARSLSRASLERLKPILKQADLRPRADSTLSHDCGCHKRPQKSAPTEPIQESEPIIDKEQ